MAVESPYVTGQVPSPEDTIKFLKFCSSDCDSIIDIPKVNILDTVAYMKARYQPQFHILLIKAIVNYIKEYTTGPNYRIVSRAQSKAETLVNENSMPDILSLVGICMAKLNMTEEKAMNLPISKLVWYGAFVAMMEGADIRLNPEETDAEKEKNMLLNWEREKSEQLRLAMVNGKIPKRKIKTANPNG